ncbi:hypothetical protein TWF696_003267 [Orbilia brochopaga]
MYAQDSSLSLPWPSPLVLKGSAQAAYGSEVPIDAFATPGLAWGQSVTKVTPDGHPKERSGLQSQPISPPGEWHQIFSWLANAKSNSSGSNQATSRDIGADDMLGANGFSTASFSPEALQSTVDQILSSQKYPDSSPEACRKQDGPKAKANRKLNDEEKRIYVCDFDRCGKSFKDKAGLRKHKYIHNPRSYPCNDCAHKFHTSRDLNRHYQTCHTGGVGPIRTGSTYLCRYPGCGRGPKRPFSRRDNVRQHITNVHHVPGDLVDTNIEEIPEASMSNTADVTAPEVSSTDAGVNLQTDPTLDAPGDVPIEETLSAIVPPGGDPTSTLTTDAPKENAADIEQSLPDTVADKAMFREFTNQSDSDEEVFEYGPPPMPKHRTPPSRMALDAPDYRGYSAFGESEESINSISSIQPIRRVISRKKVASAKRSYLKGTLSNPAKSDALSDLLETKLQKPTPGEDRPGLRMRETAKVGPPPAPSRSPGLSLAPLVPEDEALLPPLPLPPPPSLPPQSYGFGHSRSVSPSRAFVPAAEEEQALQVSTEITPQRSVRLSYTSVNRKPAPMPISFSEKYGPLDESGSDPDISNDMFRIPRLDTAPEIGYCASNRIPRLESLRFPRSMRLQSSVTPLSGVTVAGSVVNFNIQRQASLNPDACQLLQPPQQQQADITPMQTGIPERTSESLPLRRARTSSFFRYSKGTPLSSDDKVKLLPLRRLYSAAVPFEASTPQTSDKVEKATLPTSSGASEDRYRMSIGTPSSLTFDEKRKEALKKSRTQKFLDMFKYPRRRSQQDDEADKDLALGLQNLELA